MTEELELDIWLRLEIFLSFTAARLDQGPSQSPIDWVSKHFFTEVKRPGREPDHSSSVKVKNVWNYLSTHPAA
jgi:hypothetical protein